MRGLDGRVVIVAGSATGMGAATAVRLAEEGAKVVVADLNLEGAEQTAHSIELGGGTAIAIQYDQGEESSIVRLTEQGVNHFGALHGLHANAADLREEIINRDLDLREMDAAIWECTLNVDLVGYAVLIREALPHLLAAGGGGVVCTSSDADVYGEPTRPAYAAAKAGVTTLVRHVASRWGKEGIRCNAVSPGAVLTDTAIANTDQEWLDSMTAGTRSNRLGKPTDIAGAVAFLLSDDGAWINGQIWSVNGGIHLRG